jgi:hypothetical protein
LSKRNNRLFFVILVTLALGGTTGCVVRTGFRAGATVSTAPAPDLVMIDGGVYVVEGYSRPVFWDSGYYWWYNGGVWYRSSYYDSGFVRVHVGTVPVRIRGIRRPGRYVRYRARAGVRRRRAVRRATRRSKARRPARRTHRPATRRPTHRGRSNVRSRPAPRGSSRHSRDRRRRH